MSARMVKIPPIRDGEQFPGQRAALLEMQRDERNARYEARKQRAADKAFREALAKAVQQEHESTRQARRIATCVKNRERIVRGRVKALRARLRSERLLRLALYPPRVAPIAPPKGPRIAISTEERAAKQREREAVAEVKRTAKREAARIKRLGLPPLPYA